MSARAWAVAVATTLGVACTRQRVPATGESASIAAAPCLVIADSLPRNTDIHTIAGRFRLRLVATSGRASGVEVGGLLDLPAASNDSLFGTATVPLDSLGATAPGPRPADNRYSVIGLKWRSSAGARPNITLRLGADVAPPGTRSIEGAHMALSVSSIWNDGMKGAWSSGTGDPMIPGAAGHFCADRLK